MYSETVEFKSKIMRGEDGEIGAAAKFALMVKHNKSTLQTFRTIEWMRLIPLRDVAEKPLHDRFVKTVGMHAVPPPITGTFMPPSNNPDIDDTQFTYGSKSTNNFETNSVSNDFVSCDNSDKSSDSETTLELNNKPMWTNVANIPSFVPKAASVPADSRNRQTSVPAGSRNEPASVPTDSRNRPTSVPAGRPFSVGWKNTIARPMTRPTS
ncbi:hypothetical protein Tco_0199996 [Tanacetum coccineum]